jgi:hypothetical protein
LNLPAEKVFLLMLGYVPKRCSWVEREEGKRSLLEKHGAVEFDRPFLGKA